MTLTLKERVEKLEAQVQRLSREIEKDKQTNNSWLDASLGAFANDPMYEEAVRLGRQYRERDRRRASRRSLRRKSNAGS